MNCKDCQVDGHDQCPLDDPGCKCCADTARQMQEKELQDNS